MDATDQRSSIGVICAAYRAASTIDQMLASLAAQSRLPDQVVVADDCSGDDTAERARAWADRLPLSVVRTPSNSGPGAARRLAAEHLSTDLIAPVDVDDVVLPDHLALLAGQIGSGAGAAACRAFAWTPGQDLVDYSASTNLELGDEHQLEQLLVVNSLLYAGMFRRADFEAVGGYEPVAHEDWVLWVKLARAGIPIRTTTTPTLLYRQHPASLTADPARRQRLDIAAFDHVMTLAAERLTPAELDQVRVDRARYVARIEMQLRMSRGDVAGAKEIARSVRHGGDRTLWAVANLPIPVLRALRSSKSRLRR